MTTAKTHKFYTTADAYDAVMTGYNVEALGIDTDAEDFDEASLIINDGDILIIESEKVVGIASTWPFAITENSGALHRKKADATWSQFLESRRQNGEDFDTIDSAIFKAVQLGYDLADGLTYNNTAPLTEVITGEKTMKTPYEELLQDIKTDAVEILKDANNDRDVAIDLCYEAADSSEAVAYYHKAWELIELIKHYDLERYDEAESDMMENLTVNKDSTLNQLATLIVYHIVRDLLIEAVEDLLKQEA
jgi:hypothetical protein